jgi:hypothetical protein
MEFTLLTWAYPRTIDQGSQGVTMDDWLTVLHAIDGILTAVAATATLINALARRRRAGGDPGTAEQGNRQDAE